MERMSAQQFRQLVDKTSPRRMVGKKGARQGKRADLDNIFFRSRQEANYARYLKWLKSQGQILDWKYEPRTFEFPVRGKRNSFYKPDFLVILPENKTEYHEVKGWMDKDSMIRLKYMKLYFPDIIVVVVGTNEMREIKKVATLIPGWED